MTRLFRKISEKTKTRHQFNGPYIVLEVSKNNQRKHQECGTTLKTQTVPSFTLKKRRAYGKLTFYRRGRRDKRIAKFLSLTPKKM